MTTKVVPRTTPCRDEKYMGLAWLHAGFSKDPNTQVGAQLVDSNNKPLGSGYNGPPRLMPDDEVLWHRPPPEDLDVLSKYDLMVHAEKNAIKHSKGHDLTAATLYVTALPCHRCMLDIANEEIARIVYMEYQSTNGSMLQNAKWRHKTFWIAEKCGINLERFSGSIGWVDNWTQHLLNLGIMASQKLVEEIDSQ